MSEPQLACQRKGYRSAHHGDPHDDGQAGQRRGDTSLSDKSARLSWLPAQSAMLSKDVRPQNPAQYLRGISRRCPSAGQDGGVQAIKPRQETCRNAVCAFETYTSARPAAIARAMRCPVRVHVGCDCSEPPQAGQVGRPAATTNRPFVRCVTLQASVKSSVSRPHNPAGGNGRLQKWHKPSRVVRMPISATKSAQPGPPAMSAGRSLSGGKRTWSERPDSVAIDPYAISNGCRATSDRTHLQTLSVW